MQIINLTQHLATAEQQEAGVQDLPQELRKQLTALLTFEEIPTPADLQNRAKGVVDLLEQLDQMPTRAMIVVSHKKSRDSFAATSLSSHINKADVMKDGSLYD